MRTYYIMLPLCLLFVFAMGSFAFAAEQEYPNQPNVPMEYRNSAQTGGWGEPTKPRAEKPQKETTEYPSQPNVPMEYRNSPQTGGWAEDPKPRGNTAR